MVLVPDNEINRSPFSLLCAVGRFYVSVLAQSLATTRALTDNVCTPPPRGGYSLSLASWSIRKCNPSAPASYTVRSDGQGLQRTSTGWAAGRATQVRGMEESYHSPLSWLCTRNSGWYDARGDRIYALTYMPDKLSLRSWMSLRKTDKS